MNRHNKIREIYKPTKRSGTRIKEIVETKIEIVEAENHSLFTHVCSLNYALTVKFTRLKYQKLLDSTKIQTRGKE